MSGDTAKDLDVGRTVAGPPQPFFGSRWVSAPSHVRELDPTAGLPQGFRAAGVACGIKRSGNHDLGILVCDAPDAASAARFTASAAPAAPVQLTAQRCALQRLRAVLVNSGCANAATGEAGLQAAAEAQAAAATALSLPAEQVAVGSTGEIGPLLPLQALLGGIPIAQAALRCDGDGDFQKAIQTTDAFEKRVNLAVTLPSGRVRLSAQCKGAGMISPRFATLLCFVETDAALQPETAELLLNVCVKRSFERCSVDGQLSTNDTVLLFCSGASGVSIAPESEDELRFGEALDALMRQLGILLVRDGEGAQRIGRVLARGGDQRVVEQVARAVAGSPLVKAALNGCDTNFGRVLQAAGAALPAWRPGDPPLPLHISVQGTPVCSAGVELAYDKRAMAQAIAGEEIEYQLTLPGEGAEAEVFFSDLSHRYVTINAEYTT